MTTSATKPTTAPTGILEHIDPTTLHIGDNVRTDADQGPEFAELVESLSLYGVLVPLTAAREEDGSVTVRDGQRRTLASRAAGLATVPVYITEAAAEDKTRNVERITQQIITSDHRQALKESQRAIGIQ